MKRLNILQAKWSDAIRSQLPAAKGSVTKATSLAARKFPRLRAELLAAANPGKKLRAVDEELEDEDLDEDEDVLDDEEMVKGKRKAKRSSSPSSPKQSSSGPAMSAWHANALNLAQQAASAAQAELSRITGR